MKECEQAELLVVAEAEVADMHSIAVGLAGHRDKQDNSKALQMAPDICGIRSS
ncbi:hypothetical protein [Desulfitobacterium sp.]|uniref:hypothetical protein n=1 Tax=Desulfitobacterium sp. TaxID=49981 RepID=UPI002B206374|nr:hypothetical protein [Desulfitobacterium sp.]MEA4902014.1 hypothetical protein [Desulfitobacterium sp.]